MQEWMVLGMGYTGLFMSGVCPNRERTSLRTVSELKIVCISWYPRTIYWKEMCCIYTMKD